jgi:hypothetical protein
MVVFDDEEMYRYSVNQNRIRPNAKTGLTAADVDKGFAPVFAKLAALKQGVARRPPVPGMPAPASALEPGKTA